MSWVVGSASAQQRLSASERESRRAELQAARLELEQKLVDADGGDEMGWSGLFQSLQMEAALESGGDRERRTVVFKRLLDEMLTRLRDALPGSAVPDLMRALSSSGVDRGERLRQVYEEFPESALAARLHVQALQQVGDRRGAESVLEKAVVDNPGDAKLWGALYQHYDRTERKAEATAVAERWRAALPNDPGARDIWLESVRRNGGHESYVEAMRSELERAKGRDAIGLCRRLAGVRRPDGATLPLGEITSCYERAIVQLPADEQEQAWTYANTTLAQLIGSQGDLGALLAAVAKLPSDRRAQALSGTIFKLERAGDCTGAAALLAGLPSPDVARKLTTAASCERSAPYLALVPGALTEANDHDHTLLELIETFYELVDPEVIEKAIRARAGDRDKARGIYPSLERLYLLRGDLPRRLVILTEWQQAGTMPTAQLVDYAYLLHATEPEKAIDLLETAHAERRSGRMDVFEGLVGLQVETYGVERARATVETLLADESTVADGHRLLAGFEAMEGDLQGADEHLQRALESAGRGRLPEIAQQRHWLLAELEDRSAIEENLQAWWQHLVETDGRPHGVSHDEWLGQRYAEVGLTPPALDSLERASFDNDDPEVLKQLVETAVAGGSLERGVAAARRLIELQPERHEGWLALAQLQAGAGDSDTAVATLKQATETLERPHSTLYLVWADLILPDGVEKATEQQVAAAIRVLKARLDSHSSSWEDPVHDLLSVLYRRLADLSDPQ